MPSRLPVYILAGGKSSRFGSDKALARLEGEILLLRLARMVAPFASGVTVVADRADKYASLGVRTIGDLLPDRGPLGGLLTALEDSCEPWLLLLSCDLVLVKPSWIEDLLHHRNNRNKGVLAVAFRHSVWEPLLALYSRDLRQTVRHFLSEGPGSLRHLLSAVQAAAVPLPNDWPPLIQINTQDDLAAAEEWLHRAHRASHDGSAPGFWHGPDRPAP